MKKLFLPITALMIVAGLSYCSGSRKAAAIVVPKKNYETDIKQIVSEKCSPCHFPEKGGNKPPLNSYALVSASLDHIISRIEMHPGEKGFMPFKRPRLTDSLINVIKQWKVDGILEKL